MAPPNEKMSRSWKGTARMPVDNWQNSGKTRYEYMFETLEAAILVEYDSNDKNHQGDVRYRELASEGTRWRDKLPMAPLHVSELQRGREYEFRQLPLGSFYSTPKSPNVKQFTYYNYYPRPSKGTNMDTDLGEFALKGSFTNLGKTTVIFVDHPNKNYFNLATKSATSTRPVKKKPSMIEKKKQSRNTRIKKRSKTKTKSPSRKPDSVSFSKKKRKTLTRQKTQ